MQLSLNIVDYELGFLSDQELAILRDESLASALLELRPCAGFNHAARFVVVRTPSKAQLLHLPNQHPHALVPVDAPALLRSPRIVGASGQAGVQRGSVLA